MVTEAQIEIFKYGVHLNECTHLNNHAFCLLRIFFHLHVKCTQIIKRLAKVPGTYFYKHAHVV